MRAFLNSGDARFLQVVSFAVVVELAFSLFGP
jgi:hypothetical protein